ncbi:MAG: hypothetical protein C5B49_02650 [Bdellovibrio sp.]|nr:MAG: hypothetical protein C5B49_02650 [Bdellovibrio sp.]
MLLYEVTDSLEKAHVKYAIAGGYALALHGIVRATMDVDLIISLSKEGLESAEKALKTIGLQSRLPIRAIDVFTMREEYVKKRNLLAWSFVDYNDPTRQVDILIFRDFAEVKVEKISVAGRKISVLAADDLLKMKMVAARPQDLVDAENLKRLTATKALHARGARKKGK